MAAVEETGTVADAPPQCDSPGCTQYATQTYSWEWGATGVCCSEHGARLQQLQSSLDRRLSIAPLQKAGPLPLERDERCRLVARGLVLEEEVKEAKARGLDLYRENVSLTQQVQLLTVRDREAQAQLKDADARNEHLQRQLDGRDVELGEMAAELDRLRTLARFVAAPSPSEVPSALHPT